MMYKLVHRLIWFNTVTYLGFFTKHSI